MMSITRVTRASAQQYYTREDYYSKGAETRDASAWVGEGAQRLGLIGPVETEQFQNVLDGRMPDGAELTWNGRDDRRAGFDATFSAPKSVSLLAEIGEDARVLDAHREATGVALTFLEQHAAHSRITEKGDTRTEHTSNLVIATFDHHTSRSGDPQLHSHSVIMNLTQREDGAWRALAGEKLYEAKMAAGAVYRATLAHELQERGYDIHVTHADGRFEAAGITKAQLDQFSQRSQDIRQAMADYGLSGSKESERATLLTRESKKDMDLDQLRQEWSVRAQDHGLDVKGLVLNAQERVALGEDRAASGLHAQEAVKWAIEHTTERQTVVKSVDLQRYAAERAVGKASFSDVQQALAREEQDGHLIRVGDRYTTLQALRVEHQIIEKMQDGQNRLDPMMNRQQAEQALSGHGLTGGQARAANHILTSSDRFIGVEGWAGTGKTTMLQGVRDATSERGVEWRGLAVSASAARTLQEESGIPSETVAQFLHNPRTALTATAPDGVQRVYVIDEASLLGTRTAYAVMERVEQEHARAILVGDRNQLSAIEAGKPFAVLVGHGMETAHMDEILRQRDPELKSLVELAAQGKTVDTVGHLEETGRVVAIADRTERLNRVAQEYLGQSPAAQQTTLVLTGSRADRAALNELIRTGLKEQGVLSGREIRADVLVPKDLTKAQMREASSFQDGDVVRFGKSYQGLGIEKGEYGFVEATNLDRGTVSLRMEADGRAVEWQPQRHVAIEVYRNEERSVQDGDLIRWTRNDHGQDRRNGELARVSMDAEQGTVVVRDHKGNETALDLKGERHWDHGYVVTVHASQGRTADRTVFLAESQQLATNKEGWYVAVSRARDDLRVVTDDVAALKEAVGESRVQSSAIEAVERHRSEEVREPVSDRTSSGRQMEIER